VLSKERDYILGELRYKSQNTKSNIEIKRNPKRMETEKQIQE